MNKSKRFQSVVKVAAARERQAATALGDAQSSLQSQLAKLEELKRYQDDYLQQFQRTGALGVEARRIEDYRAFLDKLRLAIEQQQSIVTEAKLAVEERKQQWFSSRSKQKTYDNVMERYQHEEQRQEERREQKDTDERAQRGEGKHKLAE